MKNLFKGIIVGIGGIAPGLSGSVLLVIFGLYQQTINAIGTLFKNFKKNIAFLVPLFAGFGIGVLLFSKIVDYFLNSFEMQTRFMFLGLVLGTIPLFYKEVKKEGFSNKYYILMIVSATIGFLLFNVNKNAFPQIETPTLLQSITLGFAVAGSSIIPGVDSAVILSSLGLYELYVSSLANFNLSILVPAVFGLILGALIISYVINILIKKHYTATFSIIFGLFISILPNILNDQCILGFNINSVISILMLFIGFGFSYYLGDFTNNNTKIQAIIKSIKKVFKSSKNSLNKENES